MGGRTLLAIAGISLALGLLAGGTMSLTARAACDPASPCPPPPGGGGDREKRATATDTRLAPSNFSPTPTNTAEQLCLQYSDFIKCLGNPQCQPVPPLCPSATPPPSSTPTATPSPTPTSPTPTGTKFLCLEYSDFVKCMGNPQCQGIPLCPWSKPAVTLATLATRTPIPPVVPALSPLGPGQPLALGIGGAVAVLVFALAFARLYKDRH